MSQTNAFLITMAALLIVTWLAARWGKLKAVIVYFDNPRLEALIALIPTGILLGFISLFWVLRGPTPNALDPQATFTLGDSFYQLAINAIMLLPFVITMSIRKQEWDTMGITRANAFPAFLIGCLVSLVSIAANGKLSAEFWLTNGTIFKLMAQLCVGFSEEAIFRGYLQNRFDAWLPRYGWILVAVIFCLWHIPQKLANGITSIGATVFSLTLYLIYALVTGWAMKKTGNIAGLTLIHAIINTVSDI